MKKKALIIDDNANNLTLEKDLLEVAGFEVFVAENATKGIRLARSERPDIVVMDMRLPDMRGSEAAKILLLDADTRDIPIVFVTASVLAEGIEEIRTIPNAVFVSKPVNTRTFAEDIKKLLKY
jgi:two-component system, cell cycle response regulator DivK